MNKAIQWTFPIKSQLTSSLSLSKPVYSNTLNPQSPSQSLNQRSHRPPTSTRTLPQRHSTTMPSFMATTRRSATTSERGLDRNTAPRTLAVPRSTGKSSKSTSKSKRRRTESRSQRRARSKSEVKVHDVTAKRECITTIKLQIYKKHEHPITVTFDFNTKVDRAEAVSAEMVRELALPDRYRLKVQRAIAAAIDAENGQQTQVIGHSIVGSPTSSRPRSRSDAEPAVNDPAQSTATSTATSTAASSATPYPPSQREGAGAVSPPPPSAQPAAQPVAAQSVQSPVDGDGVELDLKPLAAYLSAEGVAIEIDDKSRSEIARRRDELLREFKEFRLTKQELLNLKEESSLDAASRTAERRRFEDKMKGKKSEIEEQWKNFIDDYKDIGCRGLYSFYVAQSVVYFSVNLWCFSTSSPVFNLNSPTKTGTGNSWLHSHLRSQTLWKQYILEEIRWRRGQTDLEQSEK